MSYLRKLLIGCLLVGCLLFSTESTLAAERIPLTLSLLQERLDSPILSEGVSTLDLRNFIIDLTSANGEFRDKFYQQLHTQLTRSKQPLGLDFSNSLIQGDLIGSRLGLPTQLAKVALPPLLTPSEQGQLERDKRFFSQAEGESPVVIVLRGPLKLNNALLTGKVDFSKTFFLQIIEANQAIFSQEGNWSEARFSRDVDFTGANFARGINFSNTIFFETVKFPDVQFQGAVNFSDSMFWSEASFNSSRFSEVTNFIDSYWLKDADFGQVNWGDRLLFSKSRFLQNISFVNGTFEKSAAFRNSSFHGLIDFQDGKLLEQIDFSNARFYSKSSLNVAGLAFDSYQAKVLGDTGSIGQVMSLPKLQGNETVGKNLILNFRRLEQIPDANQIEYKTEWLRLQQIGSKIFVIPLWKMLTLSWLGDVLHWLFLSLLLLLSNYGTNFNLVWGVGIIAMSYFGIIFWLVDRWRRRFPNPILPNRYDIICMASSFILLTLIGLIEIFQSSPQPGIALACLELILLPIPLLLIYRIYQQGRYHDLINVSYFVQDGSMRQLRLLIVRLPVIPEFPFFRDRYTPLIWERRWNWLNYYDFSLNNFIKLGFNDIRLRDEHLPGIITILAWYQWSLGMLYIALLLWTLSRTIPGLNLLIYLK
jgi:hypothetical protein